jgi:hypothetical protein
LFPGSFTLTCRDVDYQNDEKSPYFWDVTCNYSDAPIKPPQNQNPLTRQAAISGDMRQYTKNVICDWQGNPIVNSTGDPFDPHGKDDGRRVYQVEKNVQYNAVPACADTYQDCVNSDPFTIGQLGITFPAYTLKCADFKFSDLKMEYVELIGWITYRTFSFTLSPNWAMILGNLIGWRYCPADAGYRVLNTNGAGGPAPGAPTNVPVGDPYVFKVPNANGSLVFPASEPFLNGFGQPLAQTAAPVFAWTSPQGFSPPFDDHQPVDFSVLSAYCV